MPIPLRCLRPSITPTLFITTCIKHQRALSWFSRSRQPSKLFKPEPIPYVLPIPNTTSHHGRQRIDDFQWLENLTDPVVLAFRDAENRYACQQLDKMKPSIGQLRMELQRYIPNKPPFVMPDVLDGWIYTTRWVGENAIYSRKPVGGGQEQILLDTRYVGDSATNVTKCLVSPDHAVVAYLNCLPHEEQGFLLFRTTGNESILCSERLGNVFNFQWANGHQFVYYTRLDASLRASQVFRHVVGQSQESDVLVYSAEDESEIFLDVGMTKDKKFLTISRSSSDSLSVLALPADAPADVQLFPVLPSSRNTEFHVDHHEDTFFILHNHNRETFTLSRLPSHLAASATWSDLKDVINTTAEDKLEEMDLFRNFALVYMERQAIPHLTSFDFRNGEFTPVPLREKIATVESGSNLSYDSPVAFFSTSSPLVIRRHYQFDADNRKVTLLASQEPSGFSSDQYTVERLMIPSGNVDVPITLIYKKGLKRDGTNPVQIQAYGAYGVSLKPHFRMELLPLLSRGFVIALAHVRGGSELGLQWYHAGRRDQKENTFADVVAVTEYLIDEGYGSPETMTGLGMSAGGLCLATVLNRRPELYRAMIFRAPFLAPLCAMLSPNEPLTASERGEWGDPITDSAAYNTIARYSPYDNIPNMDPAGRTPPSILITASQDDLRVGLWQLLKYATRMRERNPLIYGTKSGMSGAKLLLRIFEGQGHTIQSNDGILELGAIEAAFLCDVLKIK
ncbi:prolyl oligopeptidase [Phlyctochytrium arcticum]|nr:prolyl oligopeptidase [Phlyctochytrium arcticum]